MQKMISRLAKRVARVIESMPSAAVMSALAFLTIIGNIPLLKNGIALHDADQYIYPLAAEQFYRHGHWGAFPLSLSYGGAAYTWIRAVWAWVWTSLSSNPDAFIPAHLAFSYLVSPAFFTLFGYQALRVHCSKTAAALASLLSVSGYIYFIHLVGLDSYVSVVLLGFVSIILRGRLKNPLLELGMRRLFLAAVFFGFAAYSFRGTLIFFVAFFTPWEWLGIELKRIALTPSGFLQRLVRGAEIFVLGLFVYLSCFGENVGTFWGRRVVLEAFPNLQLFAIILGFCLFWRHRREIAREHIVRCGIVAAGFFVGMIPELIYVIGAMAHARVAPPNWFGHAYFLPLETLYQAAMEVVLGRAGHTPYQGLLRNAAILLSLFSLWAMAYSKRPFLVAVVVMNAFALLVVHLTQPGSARYLFPSLPFLLVGAGLFFDHMKTKAGVTAAIALIVGTATYYAAQKYTWAFQPSMSARAIELRNVVDTFRSRSIEHVWGAPYLDVVPVRFIAGERPVISSDPDLWTERRDEPEMYAARRSQSKQGVLLTSFVPAPGDRIMTFDTRRLRLTPVSDKGFYKIFEATPVK